MQIILVNHIDHIISQLSWHRTESEQQEAIRLARNVSCLKAFFQPISANYCKDVWENCAVIICQRDDKELEPYIRDMLLWLEDLNWPGAERIQERLVQFQKIDMLALCLNSWVPVLDKLEQWAWLSFIADLLNNERLVTALDHEIVQILQKWRH